MKNVSKLGFYAQQFRAIVIVFALGLLGEATSHAAKILYVVTSFADATTTSNAHDQEVFDRLTMQGHTVTLADDTVVSAADTTGMDLVLISSSVGSTEPGINPLCANTLRTGRIPVVCYEPALGDELLLQRDTTYGNAGGHTTLAISAANKSHPLAAGKSGNVEIVGPGDSATVSSSALPLSLGTDAIIIATNATPDIDVGRIAIWAYEAGSRLADNTTVVPTRRVAFFFNASTAPGAYNDIAYALFDAAVKWALEAAPKGDPPTISLTSPSNGAKFASGASVTITATASAAAGKTISKVEFSAGAIKVGEATSTPFTVTASNLADGSYAVTAKATDSQGLFKVSAPVNIVIGSPPETIGLFAIDDTQVWRYEISGADLGTAWKEKNFNDTAWLQGKALIADETGATAAPIRTPISRFNDAGDHVTTFYFRTYFNFPRTDTKGTTLSLRHVIDDGGVFYLNGVEIHRFGIAAGTPIDATTFFTSHENTYEGPFSISAASLVPGDNVLAVEVHQTDAGSSDIVFGAELKATVPGAPASAPPKLDTPSFLAGKLVLTWASSGALQSADGVTGPWTDVANAKSPFTVSIAGGAKFYRLRQ